MRYASKLLDSSLPFVGVTDVPPTHAFLADFTFGGSDLYLYWGSQAPPELTVFEGTGQFTQPLVAGAVLPLQPLLASGPIQVAPVASAGGRDDLLALAYLAPMGKTAFVRLLGG